MDALNSATPGVEPSTNHRDATLADDTLADDTLARELAIVARLRQCAEAAGPDQDSRERILERVLGNATECVTVPQKKTQKKTASRKPQGPPRSTRRSSQHSLRPANSRQARTHRNGSLRGRFAVVAAALCTLIALSGLSALVARDALPGEALYSFRRITENAAIGLTFGSEARAARHLRYANQRVRDIDAMEDSPVATDQAYRLAFADFDGDATAGSRGLTALGASSNATASDAAALTSLRNWADNAYTQVIGLRDGLPAAVRARAAASAALLSEITERVEELRARLRCDDIASGVSDKLGQLPATTPCNSDASAAGAPRQAPSTDGRRQEPGGPRRTNGSRPPIADQSPTPSSRPGTKGSSTGPSRSRPAVDRGTGGPSVRLPLPIDLPPLPPVPSVLPGLPSALPGVSVN